MAHPIYKDAHYLKNDPVRDLSTEVEGPIARDGHMFLNEMWKYIIRVDQESTPNSNPILE